VYASGVDEPVFKFLVTVFGVMVIFVFVAKSVVRVNNAGPVGPVSPVAP
jgi:hypothetical protein